MLHYEQNYFSWGQPVNLDEELEEIECYRSKSQILERNMPALEGSFNEILSEGILDENLEVNIQTMCLEGTNYEFRDTISEFNLFSETQISDIQNSFSASLFEPPPSVSSLSRGTSERASIMNKEEQEPSIASSNMEDASPSPSTTNSPEKESKNFQITLPSSDQAPSAESEEGNIISHSPRSVQPNPDEIYDVIDQIYRALVKHDFNLSPLIEEEKKCKKRGRKEKQKDVSYAALFLIFEKWLKELGKKVKKEQRTDAKNTALSRQIKSLSRQLLYYVGSKCQYKAHDLDLVLRSYLKTFMLGFITLFDLKDSENKQELFLDFIVLCFPEEKVARILDRLQQQGFDSGEYFDKVKESLQNRSNPAKYSIQDIFKTNLCFKIICSSVKEHAHSIDQESRGRILTVLAGFAQ